MHSAERPSNFFLSNTFTHNQAEQMKKEHFCPNFVRKTPDLNTSQFISRLNNFIPHCLGHSKLL